MNTKNNKNEINDNELKSVTGGGEYTEFVDSDDYEGKKTYETAYKSTAEENITHPPIKGRT